MSEASHDDRNGTRESSPAIILRYATGLECPWWFPRQGWNVGATHWRLADSEVWHPIPAAERDLLVNQARERIRRWREAS